MRRSPARRAAGLRGVVLYNILQYLRHNNQEALLARVAHPERGRGVDRARGRCVLGRAFPGHTPHRAALRVAPGGGAAVLLLPDEAEWLGVIEGLGLSVTAVRPMHRGTPFANVLIAARRAALSRCARLSP